MIATTTLKKIRKCGPCKDGWGTLLKHLGKTKADDEVITLKDILDSNGFDDALWCLRASDATDKDQRLFAVWCARQVQHLMKDERSVKALDVAEAYAYGKATKEELAVAKGDAWDAAAAAAADAAAWRAAADAAAWRAVAADAWRAAAADAWRAAAAAYVAADAYVDAWRAAVAAARFAVWCTVRSAQKQKFIEMFCTEGVNKWQA